MNEDSCSMMGQRVQYINQLEFFDLFSSQVEDCSSAFYPYFKTEKRMREKFLAENGR